MRREDAGTGRMNYGTMHEVRGDVARNSVGGGEVSVGWGGTGDGVMTGISGFKRDTGGERYRE